MRARGVGLYIVFMAVITLYLLIALWPPPTIPSEAIAVLDADARALDSTSHAQTDSVILYRSGRARVAAADLPRWLHDSTRVDSTYRDAQIRLNDRRSRADSLRAVRMNQILHQSDIPLFMGRVHLPDISLDLRLILLAIVAGMLGGFIHAGQSFATYMGNATYVASWGWWYLLRPLIGGVLGAIFYFIVRSSLFPNALSASAEVSPFGVAAIGALAGVCSKQATDKLDELFSVLFRIPPKTGDGARHDSVTANTTTKPPEANIPEENAF
jgi:hypothetical protein